MDWSLLLAGLFGLAGLVGSGLYPGSMVGVPGERSNMAPPTLCIIHSTGMAAWLAVRYLVAGENNEATAPAAGWWLTRPLAVIGPLLFTLPVIYLVGKQWIRGGRGTRPATT